VTTDDELITELAENAFTAYCNTVGWVNHAGNRIPSWPDLGQPIRDGWKAAAAKVRDDVLGGAPMDMTTAPGLAHEYRADTAPAAAGDDVRVTQPLPQPSAQGGIFIRERKIDHRGKPIEEEDGEPHIALVEPGGLPPKWSQPLTEIRHPAGDPGRGQYDDSDGGDVDV